MGRAVLSDVATICATRTVRRIYGTVRVLFKSAVIDEHIAATPVLLEANVLPMDIDKDPE